jgi:hypothetical protein
MFGRLKKKKKKKKEAKAGLMRFKHGTAIMKLKKTTKH